jgi:hypothetical protein
MKLIQSQSTLISLKNLLNIILKMFQLLNGAILSNLLSIPDNPYSILSTHLALGNSATSHILISHLCLYIIHHFHPTLSFILHYQLLLILIIINHILHTFQQLIYYLWCLYHYLIVLSYFTSFCCYSYVHSHYYRVI